MEQVTQLFENEVVEKSKIEVRVDEEEREVELFDQDLEDDLIGTGKGT